jgi:18S rRNA (guanine1575-N7)-methyltransferase
VRLQFYNREEASKYATNTRMREIQTSLTERALELLALPSEDCFVLDVGCGSGLSGECLTEHGHHWIGCDISKDMLEIAKEQEVEGDIVLNDMGQVNVPSLHRGAANLCASVGRYVLIL